MEKAPIQLRVNLMKSTQDIDKAALKHGKIKYTELCLQPQEGLSWSEIWERRHKYTMAGISTDGVIALEGVASASPELSISPVDLASYTRQIMSEQFGDSNLLSCLAMQGKDGISLCHFLIYPLDGRQLNPERWIDSRSHQFNHVIYNAFVGGISERFNLSLNLLESNEISGHTEYLDQFPLVKTSKEEREEIYYNTITEDSQAQTDYPKDKIQSIMNTTIKYFTTGVEKGSFLKLTHGDIGIDQYLEEARYYLHRMHPDISDRDTELILKKLNSAATGFYILDDLIDDPKISDIKVVSPYKIRVKVEGARRTSNLHFIDANDYYRFLDGIQTRYNLNPEQQIHVFTDKYANKKFILRNNITLGEINSGYPVYHIRKVPTTKYTIEDLIRLGVMDRTVANYLLWAAREAKGLVFTGKGSSGKTTMMNTLLEYTPSDASGLVIQESEELFSNKPEMTFQHIIPKYDLKELAKNGLLTDIDYFIIGEVKGAEAMYFINACDTGNKGWCSVHSPSSEEAINKLADYVMYESKYNREEALYMLKELQVVVFMKNFKVYEISEVDGWDDEKKRLKFKTVYKRV